MSDQIPQTGFLTLAQIIGQEEVTEKQAADNRKRGKGPKRSRRAKPAIVPVKKSTWWLGVKNGRFPPGVKVGNGRGTFWKVESILTLITSADGVRDEFDVFDSGQRNKQLESPRTRKCRPPTIGYVGQAGTSKSERLAHPQCEAVAVDVDHAGGLIALTEPSKGGLQ